MLLLRLFVLLCFVLFVLVGLFLVSLFFFGSVWFVIFFAGCCCDFFVFGEVYGLRGILKDFFGCGKVENYKFYSKIRPALPFALKFISYTFDRLYSWIRHLLY